jgi:hypothetical protein
MLESKDEEIDMWLQKVDALESEIEDIKERNG